jgi:hypothetical protein
LQELDGKKLKPGPETTPQSLSAMKSPLLPTGFLSKQTEVFFTIKNGIAVRPDNTQDRNLGFAL